MTATDKTPWRAQGFGRRNVKSIRDPIIEPLWQGDRRLARITVDGVELYNELGEPVEPLAPDLSGIVDALAGAALADEIVVDGYLTRQAIPENLPDFRLAATIPTAGQMATQIFVGRGLKSRAMRQVEEMEKPGPQGTLAFVAIDLLSLDGQLLLDIPLLERKRLLESVLAEGDLVSAVGFSSIAYKSANGRYQPGAASDDWAIVHIPAT
jgi:ATP-dependent DNA ligase